MLRKDLDLQRAATDLYYPSPYRKHVSSNELEKLLADHYEHGRARSNGKISDKMISALRAICAAATARGARALLLITPEHPRLRQNTTSAFYTAVDAETL